MTKNRTPSIQTGAEVAIEATELVKTFGTTRALDGLTLGVPAGTVYGLLGPNGAGKTTAIRVLATLVRPDHGSARVLGYDVVADADAVRARIMLTGQFASVDPELTGRENLVLLARLLGYKRSAARARARDLLDAFGLTEAADRLVKAYSGGMRRRLDVAASIVVTPDLLFLDEPSTGLDPHSRRDVWEIVRMLVGAGTTVLLTTQYLDEADQLADRVAVVDHGKVIAEGTPAELKASTGAAALQVRLRDADRRSQAHLVLRQTLRVDVEAGRDPASLSARIYETGRLGRALESLASAGIEIAELSVAHPSLDEVFVALTGRRAEAQIEEAA